MRGFQMACAKTGNENLSVSRMAVVPFNATLVTAKPLHYIVEPPCKEQYHKLHSNLLILKKTDN